MLNSEEMKLLTRRVKHSDGHAFKALFECYQQAVYNFLYYKFSNIEAAEDVLQEVFVRLWENRHDLKEHCSIKAYVFTVANNLALNYIRHQKVVLKYQLQQNGKTHEAATPYSALEKKELHENLMHAIEELPVQPRFVFMLSRFENLSYREISEQLNISIKTVESHMGKALKLLRKSLLAAA
ncbi:MAG: RNA polymerase sigma-70 factor [bacterium]